MSKKKKPPKFNKGDLVKFKGLPIRIAQMNLDPEELAIWLTSVWIVRGDRGPHGWYGIEADLSMDGNWTVFYAAQESLESVYEV